MRKLLLLAFLALPFIGFSQGTKEDDKSKEESKITSFSSKTGTLILRSHTDIDKIGSAEIKAVESTNLITGDKIKGIRIEKEATSQYGRDAISFIDEDEIEGLLKSIAIIKEKVLPTTPANYQEVSFRSRSGFEAGCFWSKGKWSPYFRVDRYNSDSSVFLEEGEMGKFEEIIKAANNSLKTL